MAEPSNHKSTTDKAYRDLTQTPPWLFAAFNSLYHYDIDLAALPQSAHCSRYYTPEIDALKQNWRNDLAHIQKPTGWLNPPFSDILPWKQKCLEEQEKGFTTTLFVPRENRAQWWVAGLGVKVIDIVGYYTDKVYASGPKKDTAYKKWCSGGIKFVDAKTGQESKHELNKPMCLIEFNPSMLGQPTQYTHIRKDHLFARGQAALQTALNKQLQQA